MNERIKPSSSAAMAIDAGRVSAAMRSQGITIAELARTSGVSRGALHGLLRDPGKRVQRKTVERLATALSVDPGQLSNQGDRRQYVEWVASKHRTLDFTGLGITHLQPVAFDRLYVATEITEIHDDLSVETEDCRAHDSLVNRTRLPVTLDIQQAIRCHDRILLLGGPGSGKTTLLRCLALDAATADGTDSIADTPLFLRLGDYAQAGDQRTPMDLASYVAAGIRAERQADPEEMLRERLEQGDCIVLCDGLDEVARGRPVKELQRELERFISRYPRNRLVLTSRPTGLDWEPWKRLGFRRLELSPWDDQRICDFLDRWMAIAVPGRSASAKAQRQQRTGQLWQQIAADERVRAIGSNPLMLAVLAALHVAYGVLPRRKVDLYAKVVETLLESWEAAKSSARPGHLLHGTHLEGREYAWLLSDVALEMQRNDLTVSPRWWLADRVERFLGEQLGLEREAAKRESDRVLRYLCERAGLLVERSPDVFAFWHLTFQEYFAAKAILQKAAEKVDRSLADTVRQYQYHPRWPDVIRLLACQLMPTQTASLMRAILDDPDSVGRFLHRGPLLVLRCLADGAAIADPRLLDDVFASVLDLGRSRWLGISLDVLDVLGDFEGTRLWDRAEAARKRFLEIADESLPTEDLGTLHRYADPEVQERLDEALKELDAKRSKPAADVLEVGCRGAAITVCYVDGRLKADCPEQWMKQVEPLLFSDETDGVLRQVLVLELRDILSRVPRAIPTLLKLLRQTRDAEIRRSCVLALGRFSTRDVALRKELTALFQAETDVEVCEAYGFSLAAAVTDDKGLRDLLVRSLASPDSPGLRAGAARGLSTITEADGDVQQALLERLDDEHEEEGVHVSCLRSLEGIGSDARYERCLLRLLDRKPGARLRRVAAEILAERLAEGKRPWDRVLVSRVETVLMDLSTPCPCAQSALEQLVEAREMHGVLRLEGVLAEALKSSSGRIELAFVFGSTARLAQNTDSDIDLFIVGDVGLRELAAPLDRARTIVGRPINPVVYDRETLRAKYHAGNPFLQDVLRREKIFIQGGSDGLRDLAEPRPTSGDDR
jgi:predicted nucleotidyltransferase/transcriptional regulator with XRE-family HTH domain/energy-coupling factor transporter ATP-binding protein EcfA2